MMPANKAEKIMIKVFNDFSAIFKKIKLFLNLRLKILGLTIVIFFNICSFDCTFRFWLLYVHVFQIFCNSFKRGNIFPLLIIKS